MELKEYLDKVKLNRLKSVDLSSFSLQELPDLIFQFDWIESLIVGGYYDKMKDKWEGLYPCRLINFPSAFNKLVNLKLLSLSATGPFGGFKPKLNDCNFIGELQFLESLYLGDISLNKLDFLGNLKFLKNLDISGSSIKDFSPLRQSSQLKSLNLTDTKLTSIDFLEEFKDLEALDLSINRLTSLEPIGNNSKLKRLTICGNNFENYNVLKELKELQYFENANPYWDHCVNHEIEILSENIKLLDFDTKEIDQIGIDKLGRLTDLRSIIIHNFIGEIIDLPPLGNVESLEIVGDFKEIRGLDLLKKLKTLLLCSEKLSIIDISNHSELQKIDIAGCPINDINFCCNLIELTHLDIRRTNVSDVTPLKKLTKLKSVSFTNSPCNFSKIKNSV